MNKETPNLFEMSDAEARVYYEKWKKKWMKKQKNCTYGFGKNVRLLGESINKEVDDALHMLLHCSLYATQYETQQKQFQLVYDYIKELEAELQEAYDDIHCWKSRFNGASNQNKVLREENERLKKYERNWEDLRKRLQNGFVNLHTDFNPNCDLVNWGSGSLAAVLGVMDKLESEGKEKC